MNPYKATFSEQDLSFEDLRARYGTGQSYVISGMGRDRRYGYRVGVQTKVGDIEESEWKRLVHGVILRTGETQLYSDLLEWVNSLPWPHSKAEKEKYTLELHAARVFDDPMWQDFIPFNRKYRPEVVSRHPLVTILPDCCKIPGQITLEVFQKPSFSLDGDAVSCPHCGRHTTFTQITEDSL